MHNLISLIILLSIQISIFAQEQYSIGDGLNEFSINLLKTTNELLPNSFNIALSPFTIWTLLTIISEGARNNTAKELENILKLSPDKNAVRNQFQNLSTIVQQNSDAQLDIANAIFTNKDFPVKQQFTSTITQYYNTSINPMNFKNPDQAAQIINKYVSQATNNRIPVLVGPEDLINAQLFLVSTLYFKGQWRNPFNKSATHKDDFFNEDNTKLGEVDTMFVTGAFPYFRMVDLKSFVIELPYGFDNKMSMIIMLPFKRQTVSNLLNLLTKRPFKRILQALRDSEIQFGEEEVYVYLPKFTVSSDFTLNKVLNAMGIKDVFDASQANLLGIFPHYLYLSRLIQKAEIEVDEEGTVAAAAAGASITYRTEPPKMRVNKPFLYFIVEKSTGSIVFNGKVGNPLKK